MSLPAEPHDSNPELPPWIPERGWDDAAGPGQRQLIGVLGLVLPFLLYVVAGLRPTEQLTSWVLLDSLSAYYYTGAVAAFVGVLLALAVFLISYRGYHNAHGRADRIVSSIAGLAAVLVAFFPTAAPPGVAGPLWWTKTTGRIHYGAAVVLFLCFAVISALLFRKTSATADDDVPVGKRVRNVIQLVCTAGILGSLAWALYNATHDQPILWGEVLALEFFAISWLSKGRVDWTFAAAAHRAVHYGRRMFGVHRGQRR